MTKNVQVMAKRGLKMNELEDKAEELIESSKTFYFSTIPWYKRCYYKLCCWCPKWWFKCK